MRAGKKIETVTEYVENSEKNSVDLDQALNIAGFGWYNAKYCLVLALFLIAAIVEPVGYSFVLPAAKCDLQLTDAQRGFIASIPYIGIVITSYPWGYIVDTQGRKRTLIYSSMAAGFFGMLSAFMPERISFIVCKFMNALCIASPAAVPYTFIGEIVPQRNRDLTMSVVNAMQILGSALVPLLAWAILPTNFRANFGLYDFSPWRLLVILNSALFVIAATLMAFGSESPKYLVAQGKHDEAIKVLQTIYSGNKGISPEDYPVKSLKMPNSNELEKRGIMTSLKDQTVPLMKPRLLKWLALNGFLFFGAFATLNGLYVWVPDILNRVISGNGEDMTACQVIAQRFNQDRKKTLLVIVFCLIGVFCILINFITDPMGFAVLLSSLPIMGLTIGPINSFAVEIFPTQLRGMAISLSMMMGRIGSIVGTNVAGVLINVVCEATFYLFGGLLLLCGLLTFLLPRSQPPLEQFKLSTHL
ncbi:synaptic vesicle glycoprotein 2C-like [Hyposmocoma kahamanoa]|uniref:synaptic vesicle glycoprotein 2C-like n=1 Tax=Hyposmocoma kahamanoa TaxID=1477025 RepID=UPI000E6D878E|nr:synaptic vesicle glycoprotein 2C-like [Hyposmocoma kahamanoa]